MKYNTFLNSGSVIMCTIQHICDQNLGWGSKCQDAKENAKICSPSTVKSLLSPVSPPQLCLFPHTSPHFSPLIVNHTHTFGFPYGDIILQSACTEPTVLASESDIPSNLLVDVEAEDVRHLLVSLIIIPEVSYPKHIMHAWLLLNLWLPRETNNFECYKTNNQPPRYTRELHTNNTTGQKYMKRCV